SSPPPLSLSRAPLRLLPSSPPRRSSDLGGVFPPFAPEPLGQFADSRDVGFPCVPGKAAENADGSITVTGSGDEPSAFSAAFPGRSEEHTSELQSLTNLVCRLLLANKNHS